MIPNEWMRTLLADQHLFAGDEKESFNVTSLETFLFAFPVIPWQAEVLCGL